MLHDELTTSLPRAEINSDIINRYMPLLDHTRPCRSIPLIALCTRRHSVATYVCHVCHVHVHAHVHVYIYRLRNEKKSMRTLGEVCFKAFLVLHEECMNRGELGIYNTLVGSSVPASSISSHADHCSQTSTRRGLFRR